MNLLRDLDQEDRSVTGTIATTYTFGPRFFESQILDACADRHPDRNTVVLIDSETYDETIRPATDERTTIGERPKAAGSRYYLAPVDGGPATFHPKIVYQAGEKRVNAFIGSANLTQQGYTSNREIVTATEVGSDDPQSDSAQLLADCRTYLQQLRQHSSTMEWGDIVTNRYQSILDDSEWVTDSTDASRQTTWFLHNLDAPLLEQIRNRIQENGHQITAVDIITPFYGTGLAVPTEFTSAGIDTTLYLQDGETQIDVKKLERWLETPSAQAASLDADLYVHAKTLLCRMGAGCYCFTGSANSSHAALLRQAGSPHHRAGNHEVGILRYGDRSSHFEYLLSGAEVRTASEFDVDTFSPGTLTAFDDREEATTSEEAPLITAPIASVYQRAHGGARVTIEVTLETDHIDPQRCELSLQMDRVGSSQQTTLTLYPADRSRRDVVLEVESTENGSRERLRYSKTTHRNQIRDLVRGGCRVRLSAETKDGEKVVSGYRWVETSPPDDTEQAGKATERAGTDTVPQSVTDLFLLDDVDRRESLLASVNGVISELRDATVDVNDDQATEQENRSREGIRVREWDSASTSSDPRNAITTFYDEWMNDMTELSEVRADPSGAFDAVAARIRAINQCNIQLVVLGQNGADDIPSQLPVAITNRLYTRQEYGELGSRLHWFLTRGRRVAENTEGDETAITAETIYSWCREDILPNIIVGALIAEHQLSSTTEEYHRYFDSSFEQLALDCFSDGISFAQWATAESINLTLATVTESIEPIIDQLERHDYATELPYTFRDTDRLENAAVQFLARVLVEADTVETYKTISDRNPQLLQFALNTIRQ
jgi:hypothetical protein